MATALITGASSGIGAAFARRLAADRYRLVLVARDGDRLSAMRADLIRSGAPEVDILPADLTDAEQRLAVCRRLSSTTESVDLLVNNAGIGLGKSFLSSSKEELHRQLELNVTAVMDLTHAALPGMVERRHGGVINISSVAGMVPGRGSAYGASKAWVTAFSEAMDMSVRRCGVRIVAVCPGFVRTEFHERAGIDMRGKPGWMYVPVDTVVGESLSGLRRGRKVVIPGFLYKTVAAASKLAPRSLVRNVAARF